VVKKLAILSLEKSQLVNKNLQNVLKKNIEACSWAKISTPTMVNDQAPSQKLAVDAKVPVDVGYRNTIPVRIPKLIHHENLDFKEEYKDIVIAKEPLEIRLYRDVIFHPDYNCLFDGEGKTIKATERVTSKDFHPADTSCEQIVVHANLPTIQSAVAYVGSPFFYHYGHMITDAVGRMWALEKIRSLPILCQERFLRIPWRSQFIEFFYKSLGLPTKELYSLTQPTLLKEVYVPDTSFINAYGAHVQHPETHRHVAESLGVDTETTDQPLYVSRSRLSSRFRRIVGEKELELRLKSLNCRIVYPEELSVHEQIKLFNYHNTIIGSFSSGMHTMLFRKNGPCREITLHPKEVLDINTMLVSHLCDVEATSIGCLSTAPGVENDMWRTNLNLDVDLAFGAIEKICKS
jgi:capsular polysaccharide biosynthesis protein